MDGTFSKVVPSFRPVLDPVHKPACLELVQFPVPVPVQRTSMLISSIVLERGQLGQKVNRHQPAHDEGWMDGKWS